MDFELGVRNIQTAGYNGARTVDICKRKSSIKSPGLYFLKKYLLNDQVYLNFKF